MSIALELYSKVNDYVQHRASLWDLESWLVPRLPILASMPDSDAGRLAAAIELYMAELQARLRAERSVRSLLSRYIAANPIVWAPYLETPSHHTTASATSTEPTTIPQWFDPSPVWSSEPQVVSV